MTPFLLPLVAALTALAPATAPKPEVRNVRISSPKLAVSRERSDSAAFVTGQIRVDMSFARSTAKAPVMRLVCLCEVDGAMTVRSCLLKSLRSYRGLREGEIASAIKAAGAGVKGKELAEWCRDPAKFTPFLSEVTKSAYAGATYGSGDIRGGFFALGRPKAAPRIILYRIELWQNGVLVARHDSSRTGLGKYDIPDDWHVRGKYPQKFKYSDAQ